MITEALQHCRGVGPIRLQALCDAGIRTWHDALSNAERIPDSLRRDVTDECKRCIQALSDRNIEYFTDTLHIRDRWRILTEFHSEASYFDIETTGLEYDSSVTVIVCWHKNQLHTFVENENLDDFLDLLDDIRLLVSFNGSSFDVPRLLQTFHIPEIPCPHLDLRWACYHRGLHGGLKEITTTLGVHRPKDLTDVDGDIAIQLWQKWISQGNEAARSQLLRYCAADVILLLPLAQCIANVKMADVEQLWKQLPSANLPAEYEDATQKRRRELKLQFGPAGPQKLRTLQSRRNQKAR